MRGLILHDALANLQAIQHPCAACIKRELQKFVFHRNRIKFNATALIDFKRGRPRLQQEYHGHICLLNRVGNPEHAPTGRLVQDLAASLRRAGWSVQVLSDTGTDQPAAILTRMRSLWILLKQAWHQGHRSHVTAIVTMTDPPGLGMAGWLLARRHKCRHLIWCQDMYPDLLWPKAGPVLRRLLPNADHVIVPGPCMARRIKATMILNWPEISIKPEPLPHQQQIWFLYSGNLGRYADLSALIPAWQRVIQQKPDRATMICCGRGRRRDYWYQQTEQLHLTDWHWQDPVPTETLSNHLATAHIHVVIQAATTAGMMVPVKFMAAMAAGRPVLALMPPGASVAEWVQEYQLGWVVPPDDPDAIAGTIAMILDDPDQIAHRAENVRRWYAAQQPVIGPDYMAGQVTEWLMGK